MKNPKNIQKFEYADQATLNYFLQYYFILFKTFEATDADNDNDHAGGDFFSECCL